MIFITLDDARKAIHASEEKAKSLGITVSTAVVDSNGVLIALSKMDGSLTVSPDFATAKARTSASFGMPSGDLAGFATEGQPYFGLNTAFAGEFMLIAGGLPVKKGGKVIGGIGVGGSTDVSQDADCANKGVSELE